MALVGDVHTPACRSCAERLEREVCERRKRGQEAAELRRRLREAERERDRAEETVATLAALLKRRGELIEEAIDLVTRTRAGDERVVRLHEERELVAGALDLARRGRIPRA